MRFVTSYCHPAGCAILAVSFVLTLSGCSVDTEIQSSVLVGCSSNADCPAGWECKDLLERCVKSNSGDTTPPRIVDGSVELSPSDAPADVLVRLSFEVDEPLGVEPRIELDTAAGRRPFVLDVGEGRSYALHYLTDGTEGSGVAPILATLVDEVGNGTADMAVTNLNLDFEGPDLTATVVGSGVLNERVAVQPVTLGTTATDVIAMRVSGDVVGEGTARAFEAAPTLELTDVQGAHNVTFVVLDRAGNESEPQTAVVTYDTVPPSTEPVLVQTKGYTALTSGSQVEIEGQTELGSTLVSARLIDENEATITDSFAVNLEFGLIRSDAPIVLPDPLNASTVRAEVIVSDGANQSAPGDSRSPAMPVDTVPPTCSAPCIQIDGGAALTSSSLVEVTLSADPVDTERAILTGDILDAPVILEPFDSDPLVHSGLSILTGSGLKRIEVAFEDAAGNRTEDHADIELDQMPLAPLITIAPSKAQLGQIYTRSFDPYPVVIEGDTGEAGTSISSWTVYGDSGGGLTDLGLTGSDVVLDVDATTGELSGELSLASVDLTGYSGVRLQVIVEDSVGNRSEPNLSTSNLLRSSEATLSAVLALDALQQDPTAQPFVGVDTTSAGALHMCFAGDVSPNDCDVDSPNWVPFLPNTTVQLSAGSGTKQIELHTRDGAFFEATATAIQIVYDTDPPTNPSIEILDTNGYVGALDCTVDVQLAANGATEFRLSGDFSAPIGWQQMSGAATTVSVALDSCDPGGPPVDACGMTYSDDGPRTLSVYFRDDAGNLTTVVTDYTVLDRGCPSAPAINDNTPVVVNADFLDVTLDSESRDADFVGYDICQCVRPCAEQRYCTLPCPASNDCSASDTAWQQTGDVTEFRYALIRDKVNRLCVRGHDEFQPGVADCADVTEDSIAPVTQLKCWEDTGDGAVQENELRDCGTGRYDASQRFVLRVIDRNLPPQVADIETYVGVNMTPPAVAPEFRYDRSGASQVIDFENRPRDRAQYFSIDLAGNVEATRTAHLSFRGAGQRVGDLLEARDVHVAVSALSGIVVLVGGSNGTNDSGLYYDDMLAVVPGPQTAHTYTYSDSSRAVQLGTGGYPLLFVNGRNAEILDVQISGRPFEETVFTATADMEGSISRRYGYTVTRIGYLEALVTGGWYCVGLSCGYSSTGRIYTYSTSTRTGAWSVSGDTLTVARRNHAAVVIGTQGVLITGGHNGSVLSSAEIYDASTDTFNWVSASMVRARTRHGMVRFTDANGDVLIAGGCLDTSCSTVTDEAEIYDVSAGTFHAVADMPGPAAEPEMYAFTDDQGQARAWVLDTRLGSNAVYEYDVATDAWATVPIRGSSAGMRMTPLYGQGHVLLTGGIDNPKLAQKIDSRAVETRQLEGLAQPLDEPGGLVALPDGRAVFAATRSGQPLVQLFRPDWETWSQLDVSADLGGAVLDDLQSVLAHTGEVVMVAPDGADNDGHVWSLDVEAGSLVDHGGVGGDAANRRATVSTLEDGSLLVAGGSTAASAPSNRTFHVGWDLAGVSTGPALAVDRTEHTAVRLLDGRVLLVNGSNGTALASAELYDPWDEDLTTTATPTKVAAVSPRAILTHDGTVVVGAGTLDGGTAAQYVSYFFPSLSDFDAGVGPNLPQSIADATGFVLESGPAVFVGGVDPASARYQTTALAVAPGDMRASEPFRIAFPTSRAAGVKLADNRLLIAGGDAPGDSTEATIVTFMDNRVRPMIGPSSATISASLDDPNPYSAASNLQQPPISCFGGVAPDGNDRAFRIFLQRGQKPFIEVTPTSGAGVDLGVYVVQDPTQIHGNYCYASANRHGADVAELIDDFLVPHDAVYTVVVDTAQAGRTDAFDLVADITDQFTAVEEYRYSTVTPIPDFSIGPGEIRVDIEVPNGSDNAIGDLTVAANIEHGRRSDLRVVLQPPVGDPIVLADRESGRHLFRSWGTSSNAEVSALIGEASNGAWTLRVTDEATGQTGRLVDWRLIIAR